MSTIALISDIHSNTAALEAVFEDMESFAPDAVYCLGDVIGYGARPRETLQMVKERCEFVLMGNHEEGLLYEAKGVDFNDRARSALEWTRDRLNSKEFPASENRELWDFIDFFDPQREVDGKLYVHASPREPTREYVMPADALDRGKMQDLFAALGSCQASFGGHTHVPGVFLEGKHFQHQSQIKGSFSLARGRCIVNIGSVGQPRDGDPRASYVLLRGDRLEFRRVEYDVAKAMSQIREVPELDDFLAARLRAGQ